MLIVRGLNLRTSPQCTGQDFFEIRDGNRTGEVLGRLCGANVSAEILSSQGALYLRAKVGEGAPRNGRGLRLGWHSQFYKCGENLQTPEGSFSSPGFPAPLAERRRCRWTIQVEPGRRVSLNVHTGDLSDCGGYLEVSEKFSSQTLPCGQALPWEYESLTSRVTVAYGFMRLAGGHGFRASYTSDKELRKRIYSHDVSVW